MLRNLKLTVSNDQILSDSPTLLSNNKSTIKNCLSSNCNLIVPKQKIKINHKAFNVKLTKYKSMQKYFTDACHNLITSFKLMKNVHVDSLENKNDPELKELDTIIKIIIEKQFGIQFPELPASIKKDHQQYVSSHNTPMSLIINSAFGHSKLHFAIKEAYEYVSKVISTIFDINMKYNFWLTMVIKQNEFYDLVDAREYLVQNMFDKEQMHEQLDFENYYESLKCKLINIVNVFNEVLEEKKYDVYEDKELLKMNIKIKFSETKNKKLKMIESEYFKQIKALLGELAFRNRKLINAQECLSLLTKEKYDLISMIEKKEIYKEEGVQLLQKEIEKEQVKNKNLCTVIKREYENKFSTDLFKNIMT